MLETAILFFLALLAGYFAGKHYGHIIGLEEGKSEAILTIREKSLERGYCVLCGEEEVSKQGLDGIGPDHSTYNKREEW